ncbi:MAG: DUF2291 domain-containing protein [Ferruginibacter sp.]
MNKYLTYGLLAVAFVLVAYNSVYFKKLSAMTVISTGKFDAGKFTKKLWAERLPAKLDSAIALNDLIVAVKANPADAFSKYSNTLGIGNYRYCLVKVTGVATEINPDDITIAVNSAEPSMNIKLATEYVYGNAIRDASGLVDIKDFSNNMDLNNISAELNKKVREEVLPAFKSTVKKGDTVQVIGAIELNKEHIKFNDLELIPVQLKIQ